MLQKREKEFLASKEFIREPVDNEINDIMESTNKIIILTGGTGVGKTTILQSLEKKGLGCKEQTIYDCPDGIVKMAREPNERYASDVFDYFYELKFALNILLYIKENYPIVFEKNFQKEFELVLQLLK